MEVKQGYKQTELGVIPGDWRINTVNDLIDLLTDYDANGSFASVAENVKVYDTENYAWYVRSTDLENNSSLNQVKYIDRNSYLFLKKTSLHGGELLFLKRGDIGRIYLFKMRTKRATVAPNLYLLKINQKTSPTFLYYFFNTAIGQAQLKSKNASSTLGALYKDDVKSILVPIPSLPEQTAIANALSDMDSLISQTEKLIDKKKAIKQGAMQELLSGRTRLDEFGNQMGYKTTEYGRIPEDWDVKKLGDLGENLIGLTYSPNDVSEYGHLVLRSSNIQNNKLSFGNNVFVDMELPNRVIVKENDILICVRNGSKNLIGKCALIDKATEGCAFGAFMSVYRTQFAKYIFHQFQSIIIQKQIDQVMGATINQLTNKDLSTFKIPVPQNILEQTAIANVLSDMDINLERAQIKLNKLKQQKQGMMQALLTGKIRLV